MSCIEIRMVDQSDNEAMLQILRASPIYAGGLDIVFDKHPDIFAQSKMKYFLSKHLGLYVDGKLKGFGSIGFYDALIEGVKETVYYYHNFYVLPEARGNNFICKAAQHFLANNHNKNMVGFSITMKGNKAAETYFDYPALKNLVKTTVVDSLIVKNIIFSVKIKNNTVYKIRNATIEDVPEIVRLLQIEYNQRLFGNYVTIENFLSTLEKRERFEIHNYFVATKANGKVVGVCAAWDCTFFRQTRVINYSKKFWCDLLGYNLLSSFLLLPPLPGRGEYFKELTLIDYAVEERNIEVMHAMLCGIYNFYHQKGFHYINWGSCGSDPLLKAAKGFWHRNAESSIVLINDPNRSINKKGVNLPYVDIAFL